MKTKSERLHEKWELANHKFSIVWDKEMGGYLFIAQGSGEVRYNFFGLDTREIIDTLISKGYREY